MAMQTRGMGLCTWRTEYPMATINITTAIVGSGSSEQAYTIILVVQSTLLQR